MRDLFGEELCREWVSMGGLEKKTRGPFLGVAITSIIVSWGLLRCPLFIAKS